MSIVGASSSADLNSELAKSIDLSKVTKDSFSQFVVDAFWPSEEEIAAKKVAKSEIPAIDMTRLKDMIGKVLKKDYQPPAAAFDRDVIGVKGLRDDNDYLLLKYESKDWAIQIQDGHLLCVLFSPKGGNEPNLGAISEYVQKTVRLILTCPQVNGKSKSPQIAVTNERIGNSRVGSVNYGELFEHWYSNFEWWSDGKNILFRFNKGVLAYNCDYSHLAGPPDFATKPRKFSDPVKVFK